MRKNEVQEIIYSGFADKPKGGDSLSRLLSKATANGRLKVFLPWAAPPCGRSRPDASERQTINWLYGPDGILTLLGNVVNVQTILMPADSYAVRNGFNMDAANQYWQSTAAEIGKLGCTIVVNASAIEQTPFMRRLMAEESYALERLNMGTAPKIIAAAQKYTGADTAATSYSRAGEYCMYRAAEARYVAEGLEALWISLNAQERDAMCENTPRVYVPIEMRAPWLKQ